MELQEELEKLATLHGSIKELVGPSGKKFYIREQNGADDELISSSVLNKEHGRFNMFLCSIVVKTDAFEEGVLNSGNIGKLLIKDKYFILFATRIYSIGKILKFKYDWGKNEGGVHDYTDDLSSYLWDYGNLEENPFPIEGDDNYDKFMMKPYREGAYKTQSYITSSGKEFTFKMVDIDSEIKLMKKGEDITKNDDLLSRNLKLKTDSGFIEVKNFKPLSKRDMIELHTYIEELEKPFYGLSVIENPSTGESIAYPLIADPAFFFPLGI